MPVENRVKEIRQNNQLTQIQLADAVGVTRQTIIALEKGSYTPSVGLALKLAQVLNARVEHLFWLRSGEGE
ncbi:MAG: helix-turn-helix transcriptional regulator [Chloroflexota bacterium]